MKLKYLFLFIITFPLVFIYNATILALAQTIKDFQKEKMIVENGGCVFRDNGE